MERIDDDKHSHDEKHSHDKKHGHFQGRLVIDGNRKGNRFVIDGHNIVVDGKGIVVDGKNIVVDGKKIVIDGKNVVQGHMLQVSPRHDHGNEMILDLKVDGNLKKSNNQIRKGYRIIQGQSGEYKVDGNIVRDNVSSSFRVAPADPSGRLKKSKTSDKVNSDKPVRSQNHFRFKTDHAKGHPAQIRAMGGSFQQQMNRLERRMNNLEKKLDLILKRIGR